MECRICGKPVHHSGVGSPLYCSDCNAQIALAAERLTKKNSRRRNIASMPEPF
ncbi:MAG: hypothetical protein GX262_07035 [Clostridia bacterium]|jgi:hypothetical protein|nr:hypothetical protein [Clostridia bacterium]